MSTAHHSSLDRLSRPSRSLPTPRRRTVLITILLGGVLALFLFTDFTPFAYNGLDRHPHPPSPLGRPPPPPWVEVDIENGKTTMTERVTTTVTQPGLTTTRSLGTVTLITTTTHSTTRTVTHTTTTGVHTLTTTHPPETTFWEPETTYSPYVTSIAPRPPRPSSPVYEYPKIDFGEEVKVKKVTERSEKVREAFKHAWKGYEKFAFAADELRPLTNESVNNFGGWGVSIIDALDTIYLMNLEPEFNRALAHISRLNITFPEYDQVSTFEVIIRYLGGLLSSYALSRHPTLLEQADVLGWEILRAFNTSSGLPLHALVPPSGNITQGNYGTSFADAASCQMELKALARFTGRKEYWEVAETINDVLWKTQEASGLWGTMWDVKYGIPVAGQYTIGALADSAYEYLLKQYLLTGQTESRLLYMYLAAMNGTLERMVYLTQNRDMLYVTDTWGAYPTHKFEHLSCFFPGLLALGAHTVHPTSTLLPGSIVDDFNQELLRHTWAANGIGHTCATLYTDSASGLGPEVASMTSWTTPTPIAPDMVNGPALDVELVRPTPKYNSTNGSWVGILEWWETNGRPGGVPPGVGKPKEPEVSKNVNGEEVKQLDYYSYDWRYLLRPETIESMYVLWRTTKDEVWREYAWAIFLAIERNTRTPSGHASVHYVNTEKPYQIDEEPSYVFAETWKYLYLIFLDEDPLPMDKWVYNTEAHPLPIWRWTEAEKRKFRIVDSSERER